MLFEAAVQLKRKGHFDHFATVIKAKQYISIVST